MSAEYKETADAGTLQSPERRQEKKQLRTWYQVEKVKVSCRKQSRIRGEARFLIQYQKFKKDMMQWRIENLIKLHQVFLDMAALVEAQGHQLNDIESHVAHASSFVRRGTEQLQDAREYQKSSRKWTCIAIYGFIILLVILLLPLIPTILTLVHKLWQHASNFTLLKILDCKATLEILCFVY